MSADQCCCLWSLLALVCGDLLCFHDRMTLSHDDDLDLSCDEGELASDGPEATESLPTRIPGRAGRRRAPSRLHMQVSIVVFMYGLATVTVFLRPTRGGTSAVLQPSPRAHVPECPCAVARQQAACPQTWRTDGCQQRGQPSWSRAA